MKTRRARDDRVQEPKVDRLLFADRKVGAPLEGEWTVALDTDGHRFGGGSYRGDATVLQASAALAWQDQPASIVVDLPPLAVLWLTRPT